MAYSFQKISERDLARGLDQRSTENTLQEGYAEVLTNVDTNSNGFLSKRPGYEGFYGAVPIRVRQVVGTAADDTIEFVLDTSINTAFLNSTPIVVQGRLNTTLTSGTASGDWSSTDSVHYYTSFVTGIPDTWTVLGSPFELTNNRHQQNTDELLVGSLQSTSSSDNSNQIIFSDVNIDSSFNVDYNYIISSDTDVFLFTTKKSTVAGASYSGGFDGAVDTVAAGTTATLPISQGLHNLDNLSVIMSVYELDNPVAGTDKEIFPKITIDTVGVVGKIDVEITNSSASPKTYRAVLSAAPISNTITKEFAAGETGDMVIPNFTSSFYYINVYSNTAGVLTKVFPNNVTHDDAANTLTINLTNSGGSAQTFEAFYEEAEVTAGSIKVTDTTGISTSYEDQNPQLTLWGLPHSEVYGATANQEGHVTHVDSYRRSGEQRVIAGLGGNLFTARTRAESGTDFFIPSNVVNLQSTIGTDADIAPVFARELSFTSAEVAAGTDTFTISSHGWQTGDAISFTGADIPGGLTAGVVYFLISVDTNNFKVALTATNATAGTAIDLTDVGSGSSTVRAGDPRTRGRVYSPDVDRAGGAKITAVAFVSSGVVDYTLTLTEKTGVAADGTVGGARTIDDIAPLQDKLTVSGMAFPVNNGTFTITEVTEVLAAGTATITIRCENSAAVLSDFDETGTAGSAAVYTDRFTVTGTTSEYLAGDQILGSVFTGKTVNVLKTSGATVVLEGVTEGTSVPSGLKIFGQRTTDVVPLEGIVDLSDTLGATEGVEGFVRKDMCTITGLTRKVRVKFINPSGDLTISSSTNTSGTVKLTLSAAHNLAAGQKVLLLRTGIPDFDGVQTITQVSASGATGTDELTFQSTNTTDTVSGADTPIVKGNTLEIDEALTIRDDGNSPTTFSVEGRWIPVEAPTTTDDLPANTYYRHLDAGTYTTQSILRSGIVNDNMYFTNGEDEVMKFDGTNLYQAGIFRWQPHLFVQTDTTTGSIPANPTTGSHTVAASGNKFTLGTGEAAQFAPGDRIIHNDDAALYTVSINLVDSYRYYFRLNAIDANQNIVASAATGADDFLVEVTANSQIKMRLLGFPAWGNYDYDALELQVYRTRANVSSDYRLIQTIDVDFSSGNGYIDFVDGTTDDSLEFLQNDTVHTALKGAELGTAWTHPLRAKYSTVADNTLLLANIKDYPQLDIQILTSASFTPTDLTIAGGGHTLLFRRDSADAGTVTAMDTRVSYEFVDTAAFQKAISGIADNGSGKVRYTVAADTYAVGDWVYAYHATATTTPKLSHAGWFQITATNGTTTIDTDQDFVAGIAGADDVDTIAHATDKRDVPVWVGTDLNYGQLNGNNLNRVTAMTRLANAINASMRVSNIAGFTPWLVANAGSEFSAGQIVVRQEKVESTTPTVTTPSDIDSSVRWFIQGINRGISTEVSASTQIFNSRVLVSYPNFPEIFDNPFGDAAVSDSVVDINAADGQEITGLIPFFGRAVFGASQIEGVVVVFKTNSIYLLDVASRQFTKIQSRGLGCTAPFSIATTRDGVIFANESGIYRLNRDQSISYVGKFVERIWQDSVNRDNLSRATGHHYAIGRKYKLSLPVGSGQTNNNEVLVYDHQREGREQEFGAWSRYTNHPATGWTNLANDAFFATTDGQVFRIRDDGSATDFRDDDNAVDDMVIVLRASDFGQPGARKIVKNIVAHFQLRRSSMTATEILSSPDLDGVFTSAGTFNMVKGDTIKVDTESVTLPRRRLVYIQLKFTNSTKDEDVVLSGIDYTVALMSEKGIKEISE
jgi:hypothetical protein